MSRVPASKRKLVTTHDSLDYFARRYGVQVVGAVIPSQSTQAQPSGRDTERLVRQVREEGVEAIFPESPLNSRLERGSPARPAWKWETRSGPTPSASPVRPATPT